MKCQTKDARTIKAARVTTLRYTLVDDKKLSIKKIQEAEELLIS